MCTMHIKYKYIYIYKIQVGIKYIKTNTSYIDKNINILSRDMLDFDKINTDEINKKTRH